MIKIKKTFMIITVVALAFAKISGGNLPYAIFYSLFLVLFLGVIYVYFTSKNIVSEIKCKNHELSVGDSEEVSIKVSNDSIIPVAYVEVVNDTMVDILKKYHGDAFFLNLNSTKFLKKNVTFKKRGIYDFGITTVKTSDIFGVFQQVKRYENKTGIKVYPKIYQLRPLFLGGSEKLENRLSNESKVEDLTLIKDIREYRVGDSLKRVHWKLSAKHGDLYVKNYDYVSGVQCNLFLDMRRESFYFDNDGTKEELMVDFSVSLLNKMLGEGVKSKIFICGKEYKKFDIDTKEQFHGFMEFLLTHKSEGEGNFVDFIHGNLNNINRRSYIAIVTPDINGENKNEFIDLKSKGYDINIFYYSQSVGVMEDINTLCEAGVKCYSILELLKDSPQ
ncbi:uncharacterized protein (DUF58 family) [Clostridium punense]|uniref:Uncharacterized protein (DUF58 family) n=3 Tax=Clostridium TaxID=1485 RepID=A0ABS4K388_9CLOT|nr:DUF58 domain-containing protein [Clostridium punense]MBP2022255.1 uncharacterized protein (DUF58 family) [Clostridium punense]